MTYEQLPSATQEYLSKLEHIINEWEWKRYWPRARLAHT